MAWMRAGLILLILPALVCANGFPHFAISREQLLALLNSPDPQQRLSAATSLGIRQEAAAVGALLAVVEQPDEIEAVPRRQRRPPWKHCASGISNMNCAVRLSWPWCICRTISG
jgi:hypothetical protein